MPSRYSSGQIVPPIRKKFLDAASIDIADVKPQSSPYGGPQYSTNMALSHLTTDESDSESSTTNEKLDLAPYFSSPNQILERLEAQEKNLYGSFGAKDIKNLKAYWTENKIVEKLDNKIVLLFDDQQEVYTYNICYRGYQNVVPIVIHPFSPFSVSQYEAQTSDTGIPPHNNDATPFLQGPSLHDCMQRLQQLLTDTDKSATTDELMTRLTTLFPPPTGTECHYDLQDPAPFYALLSVPVKWLRSAGISAGYQSLYDVLKDFFDSFGVVKSGNTNPLEGLSAGSFAKVAIICPHDEYKEGLCNDFKSDLQSASTASPYSSKAPKFEIIAMERVGWGLAFAKYKSRLPDDRTLMVSLVDEISMPATKPGDKEAEYIVQINDVQLNPPTDNPQNEQRSESIRDILKLVATTLGDVSQAKTKKNVVADVVAKLIARVAKRVKEVKVRAKNSGRLRSHLQRTLAPLVERTLGPLVSAMKSSDPLPRPRMMCTDLYGNPPPKLHAGAGNT